MCVRDLAKRDSSFAEALKKKTYAKLGRDHPDLRAVRPCPVPLVIVGNKYDIFKVGAPRPQIWRLDYTQTRTLGEAPGCVCR